MAEVNQVFDDLWAKIVLNPDGSLNVEQVKRELFDFKIVMGEVGKVYMEISGGRLSKLDYTAEAVLGVVEEVNLAWLEECVEEDRESHLRMDDYQERCMKTAGVIESAGESLLAGAVCLAGEVGEFCNWVKKVVWHGHKLEREKIVDELGDILWYVARTARDQGIGLEEVARYNLEKLEKRYPDGFSHQASRERK